MKTIEEFRTDLDVYIREREQTVKKLNVLQREIELATVNIHSLNGVIKYIEITLKNIEKEKSKIQDESLSEKVEVEKTSDKELEK